MEETVEEVVISAAPKLDRFEERCWESVLAHLQTLQGHEDAIKRNSTTRLLLYHDPLFYNHVPFHIIEALVKAYPEGILEPMHDGNQIRYPIETVVMCTKEETRNMVFKLFFKTNPKCLDNCAVGFFYDAFCKCDTEVLELLIQTNPNFLYQTDPTVLPMHLACSRVMCKKIDLLLACDPSLARMVEDYSKMLPLHVACRTNDIFDMETFRRLIEAYPQAAKKKDAKGRLPLHHACKQSFYRPDNQDFVSELLKIYPEAARIRDKRKNLPLHYLVIRSFSDADFDEDYRLYPKPIDLNLIIEAYPDGLLERYGPKSYGVREWLVLETLAELRYQSRQVWHTAGRLCTHAFICASWGSLQTLRQVSRALPALVANFMECPLDWAKNEGDLQDGELAGIILHYTFEALLEANRRLDSKTNLTLSWNVVSLCSPVDSNISTVKTTLLHKLAYCSKFCTQNYIMCAVDSYVSRQSAHFFQADNNGNLPLHLVCCAPPPSIVVGFYESNCRENTEASLVEAFLTPCWEAACKTNHLGQTPLDILMETKAALSELNIENWGGVELLVKANPEEANKPFTKEKIYLFMLSAIGEQANLSFTFSLLMSFVLVQNLDDLGSMTIVKKSKGKGFQGN